MEAEYPTRIKVEDIILNSLGKELCTRGYHDGYFYWPEDWRTLEVRHDDCWFVLISIDSEDYPEALMKLKKATTTI